MFGWIKKLFSKLKKEESPKYEYLNLPVISQTQDLPPILEKEGEHYTQAIVTETDKPNHNGRLYSKESLELLKKKLVEIDGLPLATIETPEFPLETTMKRAAWLARHKEQHVTQPDEEDFQKGEGVAVKLPVTDLEVSLTQPTNVEIRARGFDPNNPEDIKLLNERLDSVKPIYDFDIVEEPTPTHRLVSLPYPKDPFLELESIKESLRHGLEFYPEENLMGTPAKRNESELGVEIKDPDGVVNKHILAKMIDSVPGVSPNNVGVTITESEDKKCYTVAIASKPGDKVKLEYKALGGKPKEEKKQTKYKSRFTKKKKSKRKKK